MNSSEMRELDYSGQDSLSADRRGVSGREVVFGIIGVLVGLLVLSGVWTFTGRNTTSFPQVTEVEPYPAPGFALQALDGSTVRLSDYRGKVVLLNFWGTWCEPCKAETPALEAAYQKLKNEGLVIIGVDLLYTERSLNRDVEHVREFAHLYGVSYPLVLDEDGSVSRAYAIHPIPTTYIIDREGKVRYIRVSGLREPDVERLFRAIKDGSG
jgi:cytochrome c biogenesis protein CcmG/thiol:disulfide interchange protein DsbE